MSILSYTKKSIKQYQNDFKKGRINKPDCCEICGNKNNLTWHAKYTRKLITLNGIYKLPIRRLYCPHCMHTFALLPEFVKKFYRYGKDVVFFAVKELKKYTYDQVAEKLLHMISIEIAMNTFSKWNRIFTNQKV
ncbi:MAG: hypothetical protein GY853_00515 [PVC group bacterium]|nr:hypothetical protein [PVC group bacterium]